MPISIHWPAPRILRTLPPAVATSTVKVYSVVGSRSPITTLELVALTVLKALATRPTCEDGWYVTKYTGNPLAWWRVNGVQLTRTALLLFTHSTFRLLTWAVGAEQKDGVWSFETTLQDHTKKMHWSSWLQHYKLSATSASPSVNITWFVCQVCLSLSIKSKVKYSILL